MGTKSKTCNYLKKIRQEEAGLTIAELVESSRVSRTTIKNLEEGKIDSKLETKRKLLYGLNNHPNKATKREFSLEEVFP